MGANLNVVGCLQATTPGHMVQQPVPPKQELVARPLRVNNQQLKPTRPHMHPCPVFNCVFTRLFEQTNSATQTEDQRDSGTRTKVDVECGQRVKMENVSIAWDLLRSNVSSP